MTSGSSSIWMGIINNKTDTRGLLSLENVKAIQPADVPSKERRPFSPPLGDLEIAPSLSGQ
jgi:hypothetical protein